MIKKPVRDLHSLKPVAPRFFDVVIDNGKVELEIKNDKKQLKRILWDDVVVQVEAAKQSSVNQ